MEKMQVYGTVHQTVYVEPLEVIKQLFKKATGHDYYDVSLGEDTDGHFYEYEEYKYCKVKAYITKEEYDFINSLRITVEYLEKTL